MNNVQIFNKKSNKNFRRKLRKLSIRAERELWGQIRNRKIGYKFRRQFGVGKYIVDFYCPELKLAIELDGQYHASYAMQTLDQEKDIQIQKFGITVLRFENKVVFEQPEEIINQIRKISKKNIRNSFIFF